jgi:hypothetical protein
MSVLLVDPLKVRAWERKFQKQLIIQSVWEQFSNRAESTTEIPNATEEKVPESVIHYVSTAFQKGVQFVTIPSMDKLSLEGQGGSEAVQGTEETPKIRFARVYYNVRRKGIKFRDESVDGDLTEAYNMLEQKVPLLQDYFRELHDFDKHRCLTVGADYYLTEDRFWTGDSITSAPVKTALHPNVRYAGGSSLVTWSATASTYMDNLITALNTAFTDATTKMTKAIATRMCTYAHRNLHALGGKDGYKYIILLSQLQSDQLTEDNASGGWLEMWRDAAARGVKNKAITGVIGMYRECLFITNPRAPVLNCTTTGYTGTWEERFQYVQAWDSVGNTYWDKGDNRNPVVKGAAGANAGTCEVAFILGKGAICGAKVENLKYDSEMQDYGFSTGYAAREKQGCVRMDVIDPSLYTSGVSSEKPWNFSSCLYFTPTANETQ